jgi:catechol 2,3-dioxygenase-like lactoylglutathione lyase family enzyme
MAVGAAPHAKICKLARFGLTTTNAARLAAFYESACGFRELQSQYLSGADFESLLAVEGGAHSITLGLGEETLELLEFNHPGRLYPQQSSSSDLVFQHFAIVVADIEAAYRRLSTVGGWTAISTNGPERLPLTSGGVTAFKFRDPDGHPLELLAFAPATAPLRWRSSSAGALCLGIDHSAINVRDSSRSIRFYAGLGLSLAARSLNTGREQERLDGISEPRVEVITLAPRQVTPHIELLCYQQARHSEALHLRNNDIAATRLVLEMSDEPASAAKSIIARQVLDPDGHHLLIVPTSKRIRSQRR